ncbi:hypothetical protein [Rummeliibacillus pycnus]|uniref:hypothetical protein n=1 Tax=Rummeliibacillus pycnus TaxID=101070 RepID=UPI003D288B47
MKIKTTLDALVVEANENRNKNSKNKAVKFAKTFDKLCGKLEPFTQKVQMNHLYRIVVGNKDCSIKELLEVISNTEDKYLRGAKNVSNEILKDQEQINKFKFIISYD